jgi:hypothetical protein
VQTERAEACAKKVLDSGEINDWSLEAMFICFRDSFRCVYCGVDLLKDGDFSDGDIFKYFSHFDHLLPKSKYPELKDEKSNMVLSCVPCNRRKRNRDPNKDVNTYILGSGRALEDEERQMFIDVTWNKWLEPLRQKDRVRGSTLKRLVQGCLPERARMLVESDEGQDQSAEAKNGDSSLRKKSA